MVVLHGQSCRTDRSMRAGTKLLDRSAGAELLEENVRIIAALSVGLYS